MAKSLKQDFVLYAIEGWSKRHISKDSCKTLCGRSFNPENAFALRIEDYLDANSCALCVAKYRTSLIISSRENGGIGVGSILWCPREVSETGRIRIVGDQSHCKSTLSSWAYLAVEYDQDFPNEIKPAFHVSKQEVDDWKEIYR